MINLIKNKLEKPFKELNDVVEIHGLNFKNKEWKFGGRFIDPYWRVILNSNKLEYDILFPGLYKTEKECLIMVKSLALWILKKSKSS